MTKEKPPPTPTAVPAPAPLRRAAGSCVAFELGHHVLVAEVGTTGRLFRIDASTVMATRPRIGSRIRILYIETPEGPVARKILPGPIVATPIPSPRSD